MSTTTRRRSITKTHERISQLGWEPDYFQPAVKYPSRYKFPVKAKDPMKHIMREYLPMELEKDERVYGGHDAAVRAEMTSKTGRRWMEIIKPYIVTTAYAEVGAGRAMSMLIDAIPNNELRNGYHVQFVDEIRHTGMQMALARWYAKHVPDPSGWHLGPATLSKDPGTRQALNMLSHFIVGDPVQCAFTLRSSPRRPSRTSRSWRCPTWARATATSRCRPHTCRCSRTRLATSRTATRRC